MLDLRDCATVAGPEGQKRPKVRQMHGTVSQGALGGTFWGMLFGLIFFMPLVGAAIGAASGALAGKFADVGIDDEFIEQIRKEITPGTSALFVLAGNTQVDRVAKAFAGTEMKLIRSNLSTEQQSELEEMFAAN
jgi:uncharacterized membrane protein